MAGTDNVPFHVEIYEKHASYCYGGYDTPDEVREPKPPSVLRNLALRYRHSTTVSTPIPHVWDAPYAEYGTQGGKLLKTACGSPCYAAPEMIAGKRWGFGNSMCRRYCVCPPVCQQRFAPKQVCLFGGIEHCVVRSCSPRLLCVR